MRSIEILVIGAGASGLVAAIEAARHRKKVLLVEKNDKVGKKLLATGNGRCNFTNDVQELSCYRSDDIQKAWESLQYFDKKETIHWFEEIGVLSARKQGYVYPASFQATAVQRGLERELEHTGVEVLLGTQVLGVEKHFSYKTKQMDGYLVETQKGIFLAKQVIVSTGGMAAPAQGSTGDGYGFMEKLGVKCTEVYPALTSLYLDSDLCKIWTGCRVQGKVSMISQKNQIIAEDAGEIQCVAYGLSGIPIFQISRFAGAYLKDKQEIYICVDSFPDKSREWLSRELHRRKQRAEGNKVGSLLESILPDAYAKAILSKCGISLKRKLYELPEGKIEEIVDTIKGLRLKISGISDFDKAQTTAGGVKLTQLNPRTMEVFDAPGLYVTGELLDVDGICGGYNLQWAWSSGILAGRAAGQKEKRNV